MALKTLDHVNIRTKNLDAMVAWYGRVLDMHPGERPPFPFPGAWLYANGAAMVHLVGVTKDPAPYRPDAQLEHFAIQAEGLADFLAHLRKEKVAYRCGVLPEMRIQQVNINDHDGNHIHIDFAPGEEADLTDYDGS
ncbi:MAG: VOC family protein [Nisaea sp.]|jgi:catechol 2,3-dioxygenase-like lactoylglutathione lyase family enzyme|uniref:VOC family protein n=1 Tax=Nisaea sp. TaxID=2024842 RepID=UPI001B05CCF2|nr:VOC family protein [Nisaea sp.]MBO6560286.1 VOC family protein [Nisaea sp.]